MGRERKATIVDGSGDGSAIYKIFLALKVCLVWGATLVFFSYVFSHFTAELADRGAGRLMGDNLNVAWAKFFTLS